MHPFGTDFSPFSFPVPVHQTKDITSRNHGTEFFYFQFFTLIRSAMTECKDKFSICVGGILVKDDHCLLLIPVQRLGKVCSDGRGHFILGFRKTDQSVVRHFWA